jgi:hypothetical protein
LKQFEAWNALNEEEKDRFAAFRRCCFKRDVISNFVAHQLVAAEERLYASREGAASVLGGTAEQIFCEFRARQTKSPYMDPWRRHHECHKRPKLENLVAPTMAPEITAVVSTLAKSYAQRLVVAARNLATSEGYDKHLPILPRHYRQAHHYHEQAGLDPGFFLQPTATKPHDSSMMPSSSPSAAPMMNITSLSTIYDQGAQACAAVFGKDAAVDRHHVKLMAAREAQALDGYGDVDVDADADADESDTGAKGNGHGNRNDSDHSDVLDKRDMFGYLQKEEEKKRREKRDREERERQERRRQYQAALAAQQQTQKQKQTSTNTNTGKRRAIQPQPQEQKGVDQQTRPQQADVQASASHAEKAAKKRHSQKHGHPQQQESKDQSKSTTDGPDAKKKEHTPARIALSSQPTVLDFDRDVDMGMGSPSNAEADAAIQPRKKEENADADAAMEVDTVEDENDTKLKKRAAANTHTAKESAAGTAKGGSSSSPLEQIAMVNVNPIVVAKDTTADKNATTAVQVHAPSGDNRNTKATGDALTSTPSSALDDKDIAVKAGPDLSDTGDGTDKAAVLLELKTPAPAEQHSVDVDNKGGTAANEGVAAPAVANKNDAANESKASPPVITGTETKSSGLSSAPTSAALAPVEQQKPRIKIAVSAPVPIAAPALIRAATEKNLSQNSGSTASLEIVAVTATQTQAAAEAPRTDIAAAQSDGTVVLTTQVAKDAGVMAKNDKAGLQKKDVLGVNVDDANETPQVKGKEADIQQVPKAKSVSDPDIMGAALTNTGQPAVAVSVAATTAGKTGGEENAAATAPQETVPGEGTNTTALGKKSDSGVSTEVAEKSPTVMMLALAAKSDENAQAPTTSKKAISGSSIAIDRSNDTIIDVDSGRSIADTSPAKEVEAILLSKQDAERNTMPIEGVSLSKDVETTEEEVLEKERDAPSDMEIEVEGARRGESMQMESAEAVTEAQEVEKEPGSAKMEIETGLAPGGGESMQVASGEPNEKAVVSAGETKEEAKALLSETEKGTAVEAEPSPSDDSKQVPGTEAENKAAVSAGETQEAAKTQPSEIETATEDREKDKQPVAEEQTQGEGRDIETEASVVGGQADMESDTKVLGSDADEAAPKQDNAPVQTEQEASFEKELGAEAVIASEHKELDLDGAEAEEIAVLDARADAAAAEVVVATPAVAEANIIRVDVDVAPSVTTKPEQEVAVEVAPSTMSEEAKGQQVLSLAGGNHEDKVEDLAAKKSEPVDVITINAAEASAAIMGESGSGTVAPSAPEDVRESKADEAMDIQGPNADATTSDTETKATKDASSAKTNSNELEQNIVIGSELIGTEREEDNKNAMDGEASVDLAAAGSSEQKSKEAESKVLKTEELSVALSAKKILSPDDALQEISKEAAMASIDKEWEEHVGKHQQQSKPESLSKPVEPKGEAADAATVREVVATQNDNDSFATAKEEGAPTPEKKNDIYQETMPLPDAAAVAESPTDGQLTEEECVTSARNNVEAKEDQDPTKDHPSDAPMVTRRVTRALSKDITADAQMAKEPEQTVTRGKSSVETGNESKDEESEGYGKKSETKDDPMEARKTGDQGSSENTNKPSANPRTRRSKRAPSRGDEAHHENDGNSLKAGDYPEEKGGAIEKELNTAREGAVEKEPTSSVPARRLTRAGSKTDVVDKVGADDKATSKNSKEDDNVEEEEGAIDESKSGAAAAGDGAAKEDEEENDKEANNIPRRRSSRSRRNGGDPSKEEKEVDEETKGKDDHGNATLETAADDEKILVPALEDKKGQDSDDAAQDVDDAEEDDEEQDKDAGKTMKPSPRRLRTRTRSIEKDSNDGPVDKEAESEDHGGSEDKERTAGLSKRRKEAEKSDKKDESPASPTTKRKRGRPARLRGASLVDVPPDNAKCGKAKEEPEVDNEDNIDTAEKETAPSIPSFEKGDETGDATEDEDRTSVPKRKRTRTARLRAAIFESEEAKQESKAKGTKAESTDDDAADKSEGEKGDDSTQDEHSTHDEGDEEESGDEQADGTKTKARKRKREAAAPIVTRRSSRRKKT